MKIDFEQLKKERKKNFEERLWFLKFWAEYIKSHSDEDWSSQQKVLINSQLQN